MINEVLYVYIKCGYCKITLPAPPCHLNSLWVELFTSFIFRTYTGIDRLHSTVYIQSTAYIQYKDGSSFLI